MISIIQPASEMLAESVVEFGSGKLSRSSKSSLSSRLAHVPSAIRLFATCSQWPNAQGSIGRIGDGGSIPALPSVETIILKKIDGNTVLLQKSKNGCADSASRNIVFALARYEYCMT
jgi:hypothetical protein